MIAIFTKPVHSVRGISKNFLSFSIANRANEATVISQAPQKFIPQTGNKKVGQPKELQTSGNAPATLIPGDEASAWLEERQVRISRPSKNVMQSGTANTHTWKIDFMNLPKSRWENWLMGWTSSGDPLSNLTIDFPTKEDAIAFCEKNNLPWFVDEAPERSIRKKSYSDNFSWNKRTRLSNCRY